MVHPKKHLGQHFLTDPGIAGKIVDSLSTPIESLLEIGPGKGVLTKIILEDKPGEFFVIEIDSEAVEYLKEHYPELKDNIIQDDFLKFPVQDVLKGRFSVIGNFPYNISSQILFRILDLRLQVTEVVGMFQKEVAERVVSPPGSKKYGILSVLIQAYYKAEYLFSVSEGSFFPPPKVKSAVIRLSRNNTLQLDCKETLFFKVVKAGFNQRRKTLRNALKQFGKFDPSMDTLLSKRAEQLSVEEFVTITKSIGI